MKLKNRLKEARNLAGMSQVQLAMASGVSLQSIKKYETTDASNITTKNINKIAHALNLPTEFFISEESPNSLPIVSQVSPNMDNLSISRPLDVHKSPSIHPNLKPRSETVKIPVFEEFVASARSGAINTELATHTREVAKATLSELFGITNDFGSLIIIRSKGNSMFPLIPQNCFLLVQQTPQVRDYEICVARIGEETYVKKLVKLPSIRLLSEHRDYEPIPITEDMDFEILGRVVGYFGVL